MSSDFRCRVCYGKVGRLRFLSHLEVARAMERAVRRAGLPYAVTQGFSPHMRIAFGPALPVGTAGEREYLDVWLTRYTRKSDVLGRLRAACVPELGPSDCGYVGEREPSLGAALAIATYEVLLEGKEVPSEQVQAALDAVVAEGSLSVERKGAQKVFDLARSLPKEPRARIALDGIVLDIAVRMGSWGSLRPESLATAALEASGVNVAVTAVRRTDTFIESEDGAWSRPL